MRPLMIFILIISSLLLVIFFSLIKNYKGALSSRISQEKKPSDSNLIAPESIHWNERLFNQGLVQNDKANNEELSLRGGVIPHHQVGSHFIHDLLNRFSITTQRVILLFPDHYYLTDSPAYTTSYSWQTPFGVVISDDQVIESLSHNQKIETINSADIFQEHALGGMMPYIKYHLPNAQIVPIGFSNRATQEQLDLIISDIQPFINNSTIVVASIDFSHNLPLNIAQERDHFSWQTIQNQDWSRLFKLSDEYLDSPASLYVTHQLMTLSGASIPELINKGNAITELDQNDNLGTSYLEIGWFQNNFQSD